MSGLSDSKTDGAAGEKLRRIRTLEERIQKYQKSYYDGEAEISDAEFDSLWDELKSLDPSDPVLQKIGQDSGSFAKIRHIMPMGSQEKAATPEEFLLWAKKHVYDEYLVEYKLDGASLELQYRNGALVRAVTRGDGSIGDDITPNAKKMHGVQPLLLKDGGRVDFTGGIRGEVIMTHKVHDMLFADKANCRNAANGLMKRKDGSGSENLTLITYDALSEYEPQPFNDEEEKLQWLSAFGFTTVPLKICRTIQDVIAYRARVMEIRKTIDYDIDGLVVKERTIDRKDAERARPDRQIAFKFSLEEAVSVIRNVEWSISGATYTPVAVFDPVELAGTIVQRASLANPDTIRALGLKIGSHVVVVKRGEIIPKIESVVPGETENTSELLYPGTCETCGTTLVDEGSRLYCPNRSCSKRILHQLLKWISVVDIRDFGDTLIRSLFESGKVRSISDLYSLDIASLTPFFLNSESIASEKKSLGAEKVLRSIRSHTKLTLAAFIAGFDIEGIGETSVEKLVSAGLDTLDKLLSASVEQICSVYGFAEVMARSTVAGLAENAEEMQRLVSSGTIQLEEWNASGKLEGKSFCFTGELATMKRAEAQDLVKQSGGMVRSSVTKDLTYLVTNDASNGSTKNRKAEELGVSIITETEFLVLVKDLT